MEDFVIEKRQDITIIRVEIPRATLQHAEIFKSLVFNEITSGSRKIVMDISKVSFMDSTFLGAIVINLKRVTSIGGDMRLILCNCEDTIVWSMFQATRMNKVFRVFNTLEDAVQSYL